MGSCGELTVVDEQHSCLELLVQSVNVQKCCSEEAEACNVLDSDFGLSNVTDSCMDSSGEGPLGSVDVTEMSRDALVGECENADVLILEKALDDDGGNCLMVCCGKIEVSSLECGGYCSEEKVRDEGNHDMPTEFITVDSLQNPFVQQGEQKDDESNLSLGAGDELPVVEGKNDEAGLLTGSCGCMLDFRQSQVSLESEPITDLLVDCNQQSEQEDIVRNADSLSKVVEKCDALDGMEGDACRQISLSHMEVPSDILHKEVESRADQLREQKDGQDCNSPFEEKIKDFVDKESITDTFAELSSSGCLRTLESSPIVDLPCELTMLDQGNKINLEMENTVLQIDDNFCKLKNCSSETTSNCSFGQPFYPESGLPSVVLTTNSTSKDVPDIFPKGDNSSVNYNSIVDNHRQKDNEGKGVVEVDCITKSILLPSKRNCCRNKSGLKTLTKKSSRKCKNEASLTHPDGVMKIILVAAKKKRSCFSKPARSSIWGLLGNIKQVFEQDNKLGVSKFICQGLGKARSNRKSGKAIKRVASSSSLSSVHKCSVSTTLVPLKIKVGKEFDLSCSNVLMPEVVDCLASASYLGSGSGLGPLEVASNAEDKVSEVVALGNFESFQSNLDKGALLLKEQIANSPLENTSIMEKSDGAAEELCLVVPPERVVEALIEPMNNKCMESGTSPDSEVINSVPEVLVGEGHQDVHLAVLGSSEEFNSHLCISGSKREKKKGNLACSSNCITGSKRGKKKGKLTCSSDCITEDGSQGLPKKNRAKHSKNHRHKKNSCDAVGSLELPSTEINASRKSVICKELPTEPLPVSEEIEHGDTIEALKVTSCMEVKTSYNPSVDHGFSEPQDSENLLSSARSLGRKLPKSLKPSTVSKSRSKASDSPNRKATTCRRRGKQQKPIKMSEVQGKGVSDKVICELEDRLHTANNVDGNHKLDAVGKIDAGGNRLSINIYNLDMAPGVGLGEQNLSPHNAWVRCDDCHKWRRISVVLADLIEETKCTWRCKDSNDKAFADCSIPQEKPNAEINAELGLSEASGEEDAYEDSKNYKELEYRPTLVSQESTFTCILNNEFLHRSRKTQTIDEIMVCHCKPPPEGKLGCGDECLNRMLNIECVQGTCPCGDHCSNQQFQKCKYASLKWFKCGKKGYGLKVLEDIAKGQFLIEYVGEVLDVHAYEARQREYALKGHRHFYFMTLNGSEVIDASAKGNLGRFINHSCDPNCRTEKWMVNGEICVGLFALRDIKQDEEVTFDYNYVRVFGAAAKKCYCGSPHCHGYIGGDPHNAEVIVQGDSDDEFPEPVMLTEDGEIQNSVPVPRYFDDVSMQTAHPMLKDRCGMDRPTTDIGLDGTPEEESSMSAVSAIFPMHNSLEMDSKGKLPSSVQVEETSQQMEDVTSKSMPAVQQGYAMESELVDKTSSIQRSETTSALITVRKVFMNSIDSNNEFKSKIAEGGHCFLQSNLLAKTPQLNGSIKKGKVRANPSSGLKAEVAANQLQVPSKKCKKIIGSSNGRFEAVQEKLNELQDGDGGISKSKDATKGYLKLLLLTVASGDRSNGEAIQSNRDLSMILDALLKTKSRAVLNDVINKNGLQMLHKIMKQYRRDFKKIPILRKLLKVLEYLAASKILTFEHINGGPPCHGMESFRESMLSLTEHDDKQVHQIARSFRDRWIPRPVRKLGYMDRDDDRVEIQRSFNYNGDRILTSQNNRHEQDIRSREAMDCVQQSMLETTLVDADAQEGCSATYLDGGKIKEKKIRKRKSRWDQPAETNSHSEPYPSKEPKIDSGLLKQTDAVTSSVDERKSIPEDVPPGFPGPLGSSNASLNSGDLGLQNVGHSGCSFDAVIGHPKDKFNSRLPVSYGMPWFVAHQYGTPHAKIAENWITAPGIPFYLFPPLPTYPREKEDCQPSDTTNALTIDHPVGLRQWNTSGLVNCDSDDMTPSTTGANPEDMNFSYEDNKHFSNSLKGASYDLGRKYSRQQKWNNSKIPRPWSRRNEWKCNENNSTDAMCSVSVGNVPNESKV